MPVRKLYSNVLLAVVLIAAFSGISAAAIIAPGLGHALQTMDAGSEVAVIINLSDRADLKQVLSAVHSQAGTDSRLRTHNKGVKRDAVIKALKEKAGLTQGTLRALLQKRGARKITPFWITNAIGVTLPASLIGELSSVPGIESIDLDNVVQAPVVVPAAATAATWNITRIKAPALWNAGITGDGVVVASLDTGVDVTHPDLQSKWRGGGCASPPYCDSWFDPHTNSTQPYDRAGISTGHGTGTMGIMAGSSADDHYGVAPGAKWIAAKIFDDSGIALESKIRDAFQWVLCPGCDPSIPDCVCVPPPDVVNNSWGGSTNGDPCDLTFQPDIQALNAAGITVVFAAGNNGPGASTSVSPANLPGSFAVGATDNLDTIASFSSRGPSACDNVSTFPHVVAPGVGIFTSAPAGQYQTVSGTSFSAPHVSGAAALLTGILPDLTPDQIADVLEQTALHFVAAFPDNEVPNNVYGYGLIDTGAAYLSSFSAVKGDMSQIAAIPQSWIFGDTAVGLNSPSITFEIANQGTVPLVINPGPGGISLSGTDSGDFIIISDGCSGVTVASLENCNVSVSFSPAGTGSKSATLTVLSDDPATPALTIALGGVGVTQYTVVRVSGGATVERFSSIQAAYDNCTGGDIIKMRATTFTEDPVFNAPLNISVSLQGGYDAAFGSQAGFTTIQGTLTFANGEVTVGNIIVE